MPGRPVERKLAAIFAADIAGYSRLIARDEVGTLARLKACRAPAARSPDHSMGLGRQLVRLHGVLKLGLILAPIILMGLMNMAKADATGTCGCSGYSLRIADETRSMHSHPAAPGFDDVADPSFREFVQAVSDHVLTTACGGRTPPPANSGDADVELLFVRRPLVKQAGAVADDPLAADRHRAADLRRLESPWARLAISREPRCRIRAVFFWNERQFLRDQAAMAAGAAIRDGAPVSFDGEVLGRYAEEYAQSVVLASPDAGKAALAEFATRMPPEILWLYRHAVQSTRADFSVFAAAALEATILKARRGYAKIATALFDRCFKSAAGTNEHYDNVIELKSVIDLESYRLVTLL